MKHLFGKDTGEDHNFWMSYTDLMSGFLIVFIIASLIFYNQRNNYIDKIPEAVVDSLSVILKQYSVKQLEEAANALGRYKFDEIDSAAQVLNKYSISEIDRAINAISAKGNMVIINKEFANVFKGVVNAVEILDDEGVIRFYPYEAEEMFVVREYRMLSNLEERVIKVGKLFVQKAMDLQKKGNDIEIRIEGHADSKDFNNYRYANPFVNNLLLSSERAIAVYNCLIEKCDLTDEEIEFVKKNVVAVGYSSARLISDSNRNEDSKKSRRIEIKIISK